MKRILILLLLPVMLFLCSCSNGLFSEDSKDVIDFDNPAAGNDDGDFLFNKSDIRCAAWISYLELKPPESDCSREEYGGYIASLLENAKKLGVSDVFVHAVSFSDSIYPSQIYP